MAKSAEGIEGADIASSGEDIVSITASDDGVNVSGGTSDQTQGGGGGGGMQDDGSLLGISGGTVIVNSSGDGLDDSGNWIAGGAVVVIRTDADNNGALDGGDEINADRWNADHAGERGNTDGRVARRHLHPGLAHCHPHPERGGRQDDLHRLRATHVIASYTTLRTVSSVVFTSSAIQKGQTYDIYVGGSLASEASGTYSAGGSISGASKLSTVTLA